MDKKGRKAEASRAKILHFRNWHQKRAPEVQTKKEMSVVINWHCCQTEHEHKEFCPGKMASPFRLYCFPQVMHEVTKSF